MDSMRGRAIKEPVEELGDVGAEKLGVEPGIDASSAMVARYFKGSSMPDTSSNIFDSKDKAGIFSGAKLTSGILNSCTVDIIQG